MQCRSEIDLRARTYGQTLLERRNVQRRRQGSTGVEHALQIRLHRPPRSNLVKVGHLNHGLVRADIVRRTGVRGRLGAQAPQRVARTGVGDRKAEYIFAAAGDDPLPAEAALEVHVLAIAPIWSPHHQAENGQTPLMREFISCLGEEFINATKGNHHDQSYAG